jgi:hypothetical protein
MQLAAFDIKPGHFGGAPRDDGGRTNLTLESEAARREVLEIRHSSLYAPRDFDISPYFTIVKPTLLGGFNYKSVHWADLPAPSLRSAEPFPSVGPPDDVYTIKTHTHGWRR